MFLGDIMESSSLDSTVSSLTMDDDEHVPAHQFSSISTKLHSNNGPGTTSVHELLECPVCTSSMYPPIHQVFKGFSDLAFYVVFVVIVFFYVMNMSVLVCMLFLC